MKNREQFKMVSLLLPGLVLLCSATAIFPGGNETLYLPNGANFSIYTRGADSFIINQSRMSRLQVDRKMAQLATGKQILSAADDAAGLAVAEKMEAFLRSLKQDAMNDEDLKNYCRHAEVMVSQDQQIVHQIRELIVRSGNGILASDDREIIQSEIDQLLEQIDMNAKFSSSNGKGLIPEITAESLGLSAIDVVHNSNRGLAIADGALKKLVRKRVLEGVRDNVLTFRIEGKTYNYVNQLQSQSRITDLDMAQGVSDLMRSNTLLQTQQGILVRQR